MDEEVCFICTEDASSGRMFKHICECRTCVHQHCFERLLDVPSHRESCAVCKTKYANVVKETTRSINTSFVLLTCALWCAGLSIVVSLCSILFLLLVECQQKSFYGLFGLVFALLISHHTSAVLKEHEFVRIKQVFKISTSEVFVV